MACGAKVPVFILLAGAFFQESAAAAMFWICLGGWIAALLVSRLLRSTLIKGESTPFVMELPPYRLPTLKGVLIHTTERVWQYVKKAGTVILAISILLWAAMTFPELPEEQSAALQARRNAIETRMDLVQDAVQKAELDKNLAELDNRQARDALMHSWAGRIGSAMEPISRLAGFDWRTNIALVGGFAAKEVIVATLGTAYSLGDVDPEETIGLSERLRDDPQWNKLTAVSLIIFVLLYAPCFVTVVVMARETSWRWAAFAMVFNTVLAFVLAVSVFQIGRALT
jgi:ferrous iron transport protein B